MSLVDNSITFSRLSLIQNATISIVQLPREFQKKLGPDFNCLC